MGEKVFSSETNDKTVNYFSVLGFNDIRFPFSYSKNNIYFMLPQKHLHIEEYKKSTQKTEYEYLYKKDDEVKG